MFVNVFSTNNLCSLHTHNFFFNLLIFWLKDKRFTEFCFLSNRNMNQPQVYIISPPFEPPSHLPPHPTPLGWYRGPVCALSFLSEYLFVCLAAAGVGRGMWDLPCSWQQVGSSVLPRDQSWAPALTAQSLSPWATRGVPAPHFIKGICLLPQRAWALRTVFTG